MEDLDGTVKFITEFRGRYFFLSNFYPAPVIFEGRKYKSSEHAYQAHRARNEVDHQWVMNALIPAQAKQRGHQIKTREDWDVVKIPIMERIVEAKFEQNKDLQRHLIDTAPAFLAEGNCWGDTFWGIYNGEGENHLGIILMNLRKKFIARAELL